MFPKKPLRVFNVAVGSPSYEEATMLDIIPNTANATISIDFSYIWW